MIPFYSAEGKTMKLKSLLYGCIASVLSVGSASAATLTVYLTGHVRDVYDSSGMLGGQLAVGQTVTGQYTYDTGVPDQDPGWRYGVYPQGNWQGGVRLSAGPLVFESDPTASNWRYEVDMHPADSPGYQGFFRILTAGYKPLTNGAPVGDVQIDFDDFSGRAPSSDSLPTGAPDLRNFSQPAIYVDGYTNTSSYNVVVAIDTVSTVPPPDGGWVISPATGSFSRLQRFDAALLLPSGSQIQSMQASVGGAPVPFFYPGSCSLAPPNSKGQPAIICADAPFRLPDGVSHIEWHVQLTDGTVLDKTVDWELIP
jgi:hypothetical protein